jgi:hypothetical protein
MRRLTSGASGNGFCTTIKYLRGAADIALGTMIKFLRRITSGAADSSLGTTNNYLVNQNEGAGNYCAKSDYTMAGHEFG